MKKYAERQIETENTLTRDGDMKQYIAYYTRTSGVHKRLHYLVLPSHYLL